jgi:hypothetical protein
VRLARYKRRLIAAGLAVVTAFTLASCTGRTDTPSPGDFQDLWGLASGMASPARAEYFATGGPADGPYRRCTARDGDNISGERCEYAYNSRCSGLASPDNHYGTFWLYQPGLREGTAFDMRLPADFPISTNSWQVVMQMKQTGPSTGSGGSPVLALEARQNQFQVSSYGTDATPNLPRFPATLGVWHHFEWDVTYSANPLIGSVKLTMDGVASGTTYTQTLKPEESPGVVDSRPDCPPIQPGEPIPSHLRLGIYHDPALPGTHVDIANVKTIAP